MDEKERYIKDIEDKVHLLSLILVISIILNVVLVAIILFWTMDENIEKETGITIEQHDAPITIYNNITIIDNGTRSVVTESNVPFIPS
jgi:hypothetical protein